MLQNAVAQMANVLQAAGFSHPRAALLQEEPRPKPARMAQDRTGEVAVIFAAWRTEADAAGYAAAAAAMDALAAAQPGYRGAESARGADGFGITVSYWADEASAVAWRRNPEHRAVREAGRGRWYARYTLHVAAIGRSYGWERGQEEQA